MRKTIFAISLVLLLGAAPVSAQVDFTNYVALGDSLTAGFASGSLMNWYQERSYPAVLAQQAGAPVFEQPYISEPGLGPIFELVSLVPDPEIAPVGEIPGLPINAEYPYPYNNLGIPGADVEGMIFQTGDINNFLQNLLLGNFQAAIYDVVLRNGINTALEQAIGLQPTFMTVWIGNNDELGAVLAGTPIEGVTMTPVDVFAGLYANAIGVLATTTTADIMLINLPYATSIPFATTLQPWVDIPGVGRWYLVADTGVLTDADLVTLPAGDLIKLGYGLPGGPPLPDNLNFFTGEPGVVLRPDEVAAINNQIDAFNAIIADAGATYGFPVFDANQLFNDIANGEDLPTYGGITLTGQFLLGGLFSYDGIHPQRIGYAYVADQLIQFINAEYGNTIPRVDMAEVLFEGDWQTPGVTPAKARETVMSREAFDQLLKLAPPKLEKAPRIRRPHPSQLGTVDRDPRRKPGLVP